MKIIAYDNWEPRIKKFDGLLNYYRISTFFTTDAKGTVSNCFHGTYCHAAMNGMPTGSATAYYSGIYGFGDAGKWFATNFCNKDTSPFRGILKDSLDLYTDNKGNPCFYKMPINDDTMACHVVNMGIFARLSSEFSPLVSKCYKLHLKYPELSFVECLALCSYLNDDCTLFSNNVGLGTIYGGHKPFSSNQGFRKLLKQEPVLFKEKDSFKMKWYWSTADEQITLHSFRKQAYCSTSNCIWGNYNTDVDHAEIKGVLLELKKRTHNVKELTTSFFKARTTVPVKEELTAPVTLPNCYAILKELSGD